MDKTEKRICGYSSLLIALMMSSPRLLALRENGIVAHYWHFNLAEVVFQLTINLGFCYVLFYLNLRQAGWLSIYRDQKKYFNYLLLNAIGLLGCCFAAGILQHYLFINPESVDIFWFGFLTRFFLSGLLAGIIIKIILLLRDTKQKDSENERLKTACIEAELELLKEQLNPHFLFNSLSTLSGIVRETPEKAQHFINHLSKMFRYALTNSGTHLVRVADELKMIQSYEQLLTMRFEKAFQLDIEVDKNCREFKIPHLSLQPLLENAAKHNSVSLSKPLKLKIYTEGDFLIITNNLQKVTVPENSTGIGLANLNSRFRILVKHEIVIEKGENSFTVKLPLTS